jgi:exonuclease SbcC
LRLHRLTLTAFGPFAGTQHADFDELSGAGLFLLHGATGAGKTSVLDAVCYALYAGVPGARQQPGGSLRSDHADAHTPTEVVLEATLGGRRLEITRRPEQLRPKRRGNGLTREKALSLLREWDAAEGQWRALSRSHQEIGAEIEVLTGMSREQFCQVALLPQGDFARFLRSGAEERGKLLGRLFDTGRFAAAEEQLARMRRDAHEEAKAADVALLGLAQRVRQAAGPSDVGLGALPAGELALEHAGEAGGKPRAAARRGLPAQRGGRGGREGSGAGGGPADGAPTELSPGDPGLAEAVLQWAALARTTARERRDIAAIAAESAEGRYARAVARLEESRELARRQRQYADAERRAADLARSAAERDRAAKRLERARAAGAVAPALRLRDAARAAHREAWAAESAARARLPEEVREAAPEHLSELQGEARQELGSLDSARRAEARHTRIGDELAALARESGPDEAVLAEAGQWLSGWESAREALRRRAEAAQEAAARAEHLAGELGPARRRLEAARRRDGLRERAERAEGELLRARESAAGAREHWLSVRDERLRGIAAELASGLSDGEPCAVCGSPAHPRPARPGTDRADQAAEDAAQAAYDSAESVRERAAERARDLREELAAAGAEAAGEESEQLAGTVARLEEEHAAARAEAADAPAAREALEGAEREHERRQSLREEASRRTAARTSRREALRSEQSGLEEELRQARGGAGGVEERAGALRERAALLERAAEAARAARATARRLEEAEAQLTDAARLSGFAAPDAAAQAVLGEERQGALQKWLEARRDEEAALAAVLEDTELAAAAALPAADPESARRAAEAATGGLRAASAACEAARTRCDELDRLSGQAEADARELTPLRERYARVAELAGLAAGTSSDNEHRMRLETYVLAARLEQVAAAASVRLSLMSAGRYTLVHSDERAGGRGRSGLGLHVIDAWTGAERDTATLSGGETFAASLALALGLADVVTDEAGGTRLETLFIDEGFGSLDEQTLDEVLDVLDSLRERERCVGIVSHVADLRQRIPAQLEVTKSRTGSALHHRVAFTGG